MLWENLRFVVIAMCVTILLSTMIRGCHDAMCKHTYEIVNQTEVTKPYGDGWYEKTSDGVFVKQVKKYKMREHTIYHLQCTQCGDMKERDMY